MTQPVVCAPALEKELAPRLRGASRVAIVGIGDELQPHDRLGMRAAREVQALHLPAVRVFLGGTVPEAVTGPIRRYHPDHVVLIDAADFGARPGTVAVIRADQVVARTFSTHSLPLGVVMEYLATTTGRGITLVGIQPDLTAEGSEPTAAEEAGLARIVGCVQRLVGGRESRLAARAAASKAL